MQLQRIQGRIKGHAIDVQLSGCDVFAGPNGAGKSSVLLAILAGLRGIAEVPTGKGVYLGPPEYRPSGVLELSFDQGHLVRDLDALRGKTRTAQDTSADMLVGPHLVSWDLGDYASGSDQSRRELLTRVLTAAGVQEWDEPRVCTWLARRLTTEEEIWSADLVRRVLAPRQPREAFGAWLDRATEAAEKKQTEWNSKKTEVAGTVATLTAQREEATGAGARLEQLRTETAQLHGELETLSAALSSAEAAKAHVIEGERLAGAYTAASEEQTAAQAAIKPKPDLLPELRELARVTREAYDVAVARLRGIPSLEPMRAAHLEASRLAAGRAGELQAIQGLRASATGSCRSCGAADPLDLASAEQNAVRMAADLEEMALLASIDLRSAEKRHTAATELLRTTERASIDAARAVSIGEQDAKREVERLKVALARLAKAGTELSEAEAALTAWQARGAPVVEDAESSQARATAIRVRLVELEGNGQAPGEIGRLDRLQGTEAAIQTAIAERTKAETSWRKAKDFVTALRALRGAAAEAAYAPLMDAAGGLLREAGITIEPYMLSESDWGAVTRGSDGARVHWYGLSDGERALCAVALAYAFAVVTKAPWQAVLLDRLEAVDMDRRWRLVDALRVRGVQVIAAERADKPEDVRHIAGVTVQWLGGAR